MKAVGIRGNVIVKNNRLRFGKFKFLSTVLKVPHNHSAPIVN